MDVPDPLEARIEYVLWYDNGNGDNGMVEFESLEQAEAFRQENQIIREEKFVGNLE